MRAMSAPGNSIVTPRRSDALPSPEREFLSLPAAPLLAYLSLASSMALVGSYVGLSKILVAVFPVFLLAWLRFGIAAVAMAHWVRRGAGDAPFFPDLAEAAAWLSREVKPGDAVLFKGSRTATVERVMHAAFPRN